MVQSPVQALSMTDTTTAPGASTADPGLFSRVIGIVTAPRETFQSVVARPRWLGVLLLTTVVVATATTMPMTTEAGRQAALDQNVSFMESFRGPALTDDEYNQVRQQVAIGPYMAFGTLVIF